MQDFGKIAIIIKTTVKQKRSIYTITILNFHRNNNNLFQNPPYDLNNYVLTTKF